MSVLHVGTWAAGVWGGEQLPGRGQGWRGHRHFLPRLSGLLRVGAKKAAPQPDAQLRGADRPFLIGLWRRPALCVHSWAGATSVGFFSPPHALRVLCLSWAPSQQRCMLGKVKSSLFPGSQHLAERSVD